MSGFERFFSPRPETPEIPQGRRNFGVQLLDEDGAISSAFERCLEHIFAKYCTPKPAPTFETLLRPPPDAYLTSEGLDAWARDTNGAPFSQETKDEMVEFLDVNDEGALTFRGFLQIYQLQTENDEEESWHDLSNHGFDRNLHLVSSRREEDESHEFSFTYYEDLNQMDH